MNRFKLFPLILVLLILTSFMKSGTPKPDDTFKQTQKKNSRVKSAYADCDSALRAELDTMGIKMNEVNILVLATKQEREFDVYVKKKTDKKFKLFKSYEFCYLSGILGPKRKEGDLQVPEGFYHVNWFNPNSDYHLSLKINYPNASDRILSDKKSPGGEIFIHGKCVSIGCIPLTDEKVNELYILAVEATNNGQSKIPVYIFPFHLSESNLSTVEMLMFDDELLAFWKNLKPGYDAFFSDFTELKFTVDKAGKYCF